MACSAIATADSSTTGWLPAQAGDGSGGRGVSLGVAVPLPNRRRNDAASFCTLTGLVRKSFMPATRQRSRVSAKASAVSATMGTVERAASGSARMARVAPTPSSTGMCRSISTTS